MEAITKKDKKESFLQDDMLNKLLSDEINFLQFRDLFLELDQKGNHTEEAWENIKMLENKDLREKVGNAGEKYEKALFGMLSISYFHHAQGVQKKEFFEKAYDYALKNVEDIGYQNWVGYVYGTVCYFRNDVDGLEKTIEEIGDNGNNLKILKKLLLSLQRGENPESKYLEVYGC